MDYEIRHRPSYSLAVLKLNEGETVRAEAGAMVSMSANVDITTSAAGGVMKGLLRKVLTKESFFQNTFTPQGGPGEVTLAPDLPGDMEALDLAGEELYVQGGSYLASTEGIEVDTKWGGFKSFFGREGLFLLKLSGTGLVFLSSYGAIEKVDIPAGQNYVVDTGHMVAFDGSIEYKLRKVGGLKSFFFSGEGLVAEYTGPGRLYLQSRSFDAFISKIIPYLPSKSSN